VTLYQLLPRADELCIEIQENRERMVNVVKANRVTVRRSRLISIMHWAAKATRMFNKARDNGSGNERETHV
jgi:hypothetical protein